MPEVRLSEVSKSFGRIEAIHHFDLEIKSGEYICVLGPTGSGKTTLLRLIAGLICPDDGKITFDGKLVNDLSPEERDIAYFPQQYALFPHLNVLENVAFGPKTRGVAYEEAKTQALKVLETVKLDQRANAFPRELSGGMQQRVALARALASGAKLLLLDEPLGALDARLRVELRYHIKSLVKSAGLTAIHVTHDQREAMIVADRIVVLRMGKVEQVGTPYHIYQSPATLFVANFVGETNFLEGTIKSVNSVGALVELQDGFRVKVQETSYLSGEEVVLAIRQELTSLMPVDYDGENAIQGEVKAVRFLGDSIRVEVILVNNLLISARIPISQVKIYPKVKDKVAISFKPADVFVFCTTARGLAKEIEVI
ncbi:MAG: transporter ATP-binding protein [Thermoproteota archaeon]|nr:transporter ATP-binding protein [Thermoproteota archaeon]